MKPKQIAWVAAISLAVVMATKAYEQKSAGGRKAPMTRP